MSKVQTPDPKGQSIFEQETMFEINDVAFMRIQVAVDRIRATGIEWTRFELLLSFIGAAWLKKWHRFGMRVLVAGIAVIAWSFGMMMAPYYWGYLLVYSFFLMILGLIIVGIWVFVDREALLLFTPGGMFKIEGSLYFVESLWKVISPKL